MINKEDSSEPNQKALKTVDDSMKFECVHSCMKGQVGSFENPGVCLQTFPFFPFFSPLFCSLHFLHGNYLLPKRKCLLHKLLSLFSEKWHQF